jgi:hypothetical protein
MPAVRQCAGAALAASLQQGAGRRPERKIGYSVYGLGVTFFPEN